MRLDKWLWAARFFKTRALAAKSCEMGRVLAHGQPAKPARDIKLGDMLQVKNESGDFNVEVLLFSHVRGPATAAQALYRETEESRTRRLQLAEERRAMAPLDVTTTGRPSKRDRRLLGRFRGR